MSQGYDFGGSAPDTTGTNNAAPGTQPNLQGAAELSEASAGGAQPGGILGAAGSITSTGINAVKQGADTVVNAGKGALEFVGSAAGGLVSNLKRGFSKSGDSTE